MKFRIFLHDSTKILLSKTSNFDRKKIVMLFDALKSNFEIFWCNPLPPSLSPIRHQFYFCKHRISTEYQISILLDLLEITFEIFWCIPPPPLFLSPIRHNFYLRKPTISIANQISMLFDVLKSTYEIFWYNPPPSSPTDSTPILLPKTSNFDRKIKFRWYSTH